MSRLLTLFSCCPAWAVSMLVAETTQLSDVESERIARQIEGSVPVALAQGLEASLWAPEQLLTDPVAIDVTDDGEVWVSATLRRRSSMFDLRSFEHWVAESWSWESVQERIDFLRAELSPEYSARNTWLRDFNEDGSHDWRDLLQEREEVYRLLDQSGDGRADLSERFRWIDSSVETDIASGLLVHDGSVYLGLLPDVWRIQDLDGDGEYESKVSISSGYGVHVGIGGHAISGLKLGPDGRIYWGVGDVGFNGVDQTGKRWKFPRQGVVVRSEPDGSGFEVYAHGLRNLHEFDWDAYGNLIGVDNDGDHAGEEERLVYLIDGADSGWRNNWQMGKYTDPKNNAYKVWMDEGYAKPRFKGQAAHILPPLDNYHTGPAGLVFQPGTALGAKWKDHFFVASFTGNAANSKVFAYSLRANGASFALDNDEELLSGITSVGIDFGPDGALYLADWVEGWDTDGIGRIWKVNTSEQDGVLAQQTQSLLAENYARIAPDLLVELLGHEDRRVRMKAQLEFVKRDGSEELLELAYGDAPLLARLHAIWGLGQLARAGDLEGERLTGLLVDSDAEVRAQAARVLGDIRCGAASDGLKRLLEDDSLRSRLMATEALGRIGASDAYQAILKMLETNADEDVYLRHAGAIALSRIDDGDRLRHLVDHASRAVRIAGVVALDRIDHAGVSRFLDDEDELVATAAARAICDEEHLEGGLRELGRRLGRREGASEAFIRRSINANLYSGRAEDALRLAEFAARETEDLEMRIEAIDTLSVWVDASVYDRVSGRVMPRPRNDLRDAQQAVASVFDQLIASEGQGLRLAAIEALGQLEVGTFEQSLLQIVDSGFSEDERSAALKALVSMDARAAVAGLEYALADVSERVRSLALEQFARIKIEDEQRVGLLEVALENGSVSEVQAAIEALGRLKVPAANRVLEKQFLALEQGHFPEGALLELLEAAKHSEDAALQARLQRYRSRQEGKSELARFEASLFGGDPLIGREIVYAAPSAQCIRCHAIDGEGGDVGPDLGDVAARLSREQLLESLVDPSAGIAPGYGIVAVTTKEGNSVQGVLVQEDALSLELLVGRERVSVAKDSIAQRMNAPSSMPPMGALLSPEQLRDVVAYLVGLDGKADKKKSRAPRKGHGE